MKTNLIMTVGLVAMLGICGTALKADATEGATKVRGEQKGKRRGKPTEEQKARRAQFRKMMQEKYPEEMKAIKELFATDKEAAKAKLKALVKKMRAEHKNSKGDKRVGYLLKKYPEEMKAIKELRETDPEAAKAKLKALVKKMRAERKNSKGGKRVGYLLKKYPEEMKAIKELRETDPEAAKAKFKALIEKAKAAREQRKQNKKGKQSAE
ncbi:MAG: hypothetical protein L3J71_09060 [Victivallaceae bacterium]|nr:hypothetical protein [Victivallaceae bacterium]